MMIRCYECIHYKAIKNRNTGGWCHDPSMDGKLRVDAIDYCDKAEKKGESK